MMDRRERYARLVCIAEGQKPDTPWPAVNGQPMWTYHLATADAVLKEADADIAKDGAIK